jgi:hypothetical protein
MVARVLIAGVVLISTVVIAGPASAKVDIAKANISGPGVEGKIRIDNPDTDGLWESGVDLRGGLDDARAESLEELGLSPVDLGPKYRVTYRFFGDDLIRQDLYPYAKGGPVTYTPAGQHVVEGQPWGGAITAGWHRSSLTFLQYLVDHGLPERNPVAPVAGEEAAAGVRSSPWAAVVVVLVPLAALSLAIVAVRRRMPD